MSYDDESKREEDVGTEAVEPEAEEPKAEELKAEELKAEEPKAEEPKAEEPKAAKPARAEPEDPPQPDGNSLEVVTTGPDDGRGGQSSGRPRRQRSSGNRHGGISADDPFWTFGTPPETWGSSIKRPTGDANRRPRVYLECMGCGVKVEKKRAHGQGRVPCPMCGLPMRLSRPA